MVETTADVRRDIELTRERMSTTIRELEHKLGDVEAGFAEADVVVERSFKTQPVHQGYIEPHACLVSVTSDDKATVWSSSQGQFMVRAMTAYLTGIPQSDIRAIPAEIGGVDIGGLLLLFHGLAEGLRRELDDDGEDVYVLVVSHVFDSEIGPTHLGVITDGHPDSTETLQKIANDVRTQAGAAAQ
jgi:hypothetical protein